MSYSIDFTGLVRSLVPVRLRKAVELAWLQCLVHPVREVYERFAQNRGNNIYSLNHNSQVVYLQAALNDTFDSMARRIYITDAQIADPLFTYLIAENQPVWLGLGSEAGATTYPCPQWLFTAAEAGASGYVFIIMIPAAVAYEPVRLHALVDKYRLPSKGNYGVVVF